MSVAPKAAGQFRAVVILGPWTLHGGPPSERVQARSDRWLKHSRLAKRGQEKACPRFRIPIRKARTSSRNGHRSVIARRTWESCSGPGGRRCAVIRQPESFLSGSQVCTKDARENEKGRYSVGARVFAPALLMVSRDTRLVSEEATPTDPASVGRSTSGHRWASQRIGPGAVGQVPRG